MRRSSPARMRGERWRERSEAPEGATRAGKEYKLLRRVFQPRGILALERLHQLRNRHLVAGGAA
jgi:hypothetical protein